MARPLRPCTTPGCPTLVTSGHCARHQRPAWQHTTPTPALSGRPWRRTKAAVIARDGGICWLCELPGADTADHVIARARGGSNDPANLRAAHRRCNERKANGADKGRLMRGAA